MKWQLIHVNIKNTLKDFCNTGCVNKYNSIITNKHHIVQQYINNEVAENLKRIIFLNRFDINYVSKDCYPWLSIFNEVERLDNFYVWNMRKYYTPLLSIYTSSIIDGFAKIEFYWCNDNCPIVIQYEYTTPEYIITEYYAASSM